MCWNPFHILQPCPPVRGAALGMWFTQCVLHCVTVFLHVGATSRQGCGPYNCGTGRPRACMSDVEHIDTYSVTHTLTHARTHIHTLTHTHYTHTHTRTHTHTHTHTQKCRLLDASLNTGTKLLTHPTKTRLSDAPPIVFNKHPMPGTPSIIKDF